MRQGLSAQLGLQESVPLAPLTTLGVGGPARYLLDVASAPDIDEAWKWASRSNAQVLFLGEGSNVLFADEGFDGLILRNRTRGRDRSSDEVSVAGGENLPELIRWLNQQGLSGMERMYGIPGTLAGAVVGNAGAYGQEICDCLVEATVWSPQGVFALPCAEMSFRYRHSIFKKRRDWFVLYCRLRLNPSQGNLQEVSDAILEKRLEKYPVGLRCPGSFFKNVVAEGLPPDVRRRVPADFEMHGKIPAGKLLEAVGAKGARKGDAQFAAYHGNLLMNSGAARSQDILSLSSEYADRVFERFGIRLEPEILIVRKEPI